MEIKVCIHKKQDFEKFGQFIYETFTEDDLIEWAKKVVRDRYFGDHEVIGIDVESIIP